MAGVLVLHGKRCPFIKVTMLVCMLVIFIGELEQVQGLECNKCHGTLEKCTAEEEAQTMECQPNQECALVIWWNAEDDSVPKKAIQKCHYITQQKCSESDGLAECRCSTDGCNKDLETCSQECN